MCRLASFLQFMTLIVFSVFWVAIMDYLTFLFNCDWEHYNTAKGPVHHYFPSHSELTAVLALVRLTALVQRFCLHTCCTDNSRIQQPTL